MKIKAKNQSVVSMKLIVPVDGCISVDANGEAEVSPKCAATLVKSTNDWEYVKKSVVDGEVEEEKEVEDIEEGQSSDERDKFEEYLNGLTLAEMKEYAKQGGLPEEEYKKLNKNLMKAYLMDKWDEMAKEAAEAETEEEGDADETEGEEEE